MSQLPLPLDGVKVTPTPAMRRDMAKLAQCAQCGVVICVPFSGGHTPDDRLAACPRCGETRWLRQTRHAGPFRVEVAP